jgi:hypothetical protein
VIDRAIKLLVRRFLTKGRNRISPVTSRPGSLKLGQLGTRRHDPDLARSELDDQGGVPLDADDAAQAVFVVCYHVLLGELLRGRGRRAVEGTCGQVTPGTGAGRFHLLSMRLLRGYRRV